MDFDLQDTIDLLLANNQKRAAKFSHEREIRLYQFQTWIYFPSSDKRVRTAGLAASMDPVAALKREQAKARAGMARLSKERSKFSPHTPAVTSDEEGLHRAVQHAQALREILVGIKQHEKRARALQLVDRSLADVREDIRRRQQNGELRWSAA